MLLDPILDIPCKTLMHICNLLNETIAFPNPFPRPTLLQEYKISPH